MTDAPPPDVAVLILEQIHDAVVAIDADERVTYWGPGAAALYGIPAAQALGARLSELYQYRWGSPEEARQAFEALEGAGRWSGSNVHVLRSGEERHVESTVTILRDRAGRRAGLLAVIRDQTERVRAEAAQAVAEAALVEQQRELFELADNLPQLALIADSRGAPLWVNRRFVELTGYTIDDLRRDRMLGVHPDHAERVHAAWERATASGEPVEETCPLRARDGLYRWFLLRATPIRSADGQIVRWLAAGTDVTERHVLDAATRVLSASLDHRETLDRLAHLAVPELADCCVVSLLEDGRLQRVALVHRDPRLQALARDTAARHPPEPRTDDESWQILRSGQPHMFAEVTEPMRAAAATARPADAARELELRSWIGAPLIARGQPIGVLHLMMGPSGRRYSEADLRLAAELGQRAGIAVDNARLYRDAREAVRQREDVLAIVSHDLRNPLSTISLGAALLEKSVVGDPRAQRHLESVGRAAESMRQMIDDLLDMASINAGKLAIRPGRVDAGELIAEVLDLHEPHAAERGVALRRELAVGGVPLLADRSRMAQVFGNLLGNALKFCDRGDAIAVRAARADGRVRVAITDTGPGIPAAELPRVFEPYWSKPGTKKGTGLGLFIARAIVEAHGGTLTAESAPGGGATFTLTLPLAVDP